jgi:hypothetical protein
MVVKEIQDTYNHSKVWVIKITKCYHYYVNQKICGKLLYPYFARMRKRSLLEIGLKI